MSALDPLLLRWSGRPELAVRDVVVFACAFATLFSVAWSFLNYHNRRPVARKKRSVVDTFTMTLFFVGFSTCLSREIGVVRVVSEAVEMGLLLIGLAVVICGCVVNVVGRSQLGSTWSNQISIYDQHKLIVRGMFKLVRHPLYASIIWMFIGASVAYLNYVTFFMTLLIFIPAMCLRARQEEAILVNVFPEYQSYREQTGMFLPRVHRSR